MGGIPKKYHVLLAEPVPDGKGWRAWCPFCIKFHFHGAMEGHRVAHCASAQSPFSEKGYFLMNRNKVFGEMGSK